MHSQKLPSSKWFYYLLAAWKYPVVLNWQDDWEDSVVNRRFEALFWWNSGETLEGFYKIGGRAWTIKEASAWSL